MHRYAVFASLALILFAAPAAAQQQDPDVGPGMVGPDSPIYGLEVAWDDAAMSVGLKRAGTVVQERAAEAQQMQERNNTEGMQRAAQEMSNVAERATADDTEGLQKAQSVLQAVMERAPEEAQQGLQTALDNVQQARERAGAPGDLPGNGSVNATQLMNEARQLREQGRQGIDEGNAALDDGNYSQAMTRFENAEQRFREARQRISDLDSAAAQDLRSRLSSAVSGSQNLQDSVQAYMDGDNQTAQQEAQDAQSDFDDARGDGQ